MSEETNYRLPWEAVKYDGFSVVDNRGAVVTRIRSDFLDGDEALAAARRIAACVNACEGMDDPSAAIQDLRNTQHFYYNIGEMLADEPGDARDPEEKVRLLLAEVKRLREQRDILLDTVKAEFVNFVYAADPDGNGFYDWTPRLEVENYAEILISCGVDPVEWLKESFEVYNEEAEEPHPAYTLALEIIGAASACPVCDGSPVPSPETDPETGEDTLDESADSCWNCEGDGERR